MDDFDRGMVVRHLADNLGNGLSSYFPLYLSTANEAGRLFGAEAETRPNLSNIAIQYLQRVAATEADLFNHIVAVLNTPFYRTCNAGALRLDWPRVPLPRDRQKLLRSADCGLTLTRLFDIENAFEGVTAGAIRPELRTIAVISAFAGGQLDTAAEGTLKIAKRWGYLQGTAVFPGPDSAIEREYGPGELSAIEEGAACLRLPLETALALLGETTFDVPLNDCAYWKNVPKRVWHFSASGYAVLKKWLSYREGAILGRSASLAEIRAFRDIARRMAAILLLRSELDLVYQELAATADLQPGVPG